MVVVFPEERRCVNAMRTPEELMAYDYGRGRGQMYLDDGNHVCELRLRASEIGFSTHRKLLGGRNER